MLFEPELETSSWWLYYALWSAPIYLGLRSIVEVASGASENLVLTYVLLTVSVYFILLPLPQALQKVHGNPRWHSPWRWACRSLRYATRSSELQFFALGPAGAFFFISYTAVDAYVFSDGSSLRVGSTCSWGGWLLQLMMRPLMAQFGRHIAYNTMCRGFGATHSLALKTLGLVCLHCILSFVPVRLATSSVDGMALAGVLVVDWGVFCSRSLSFFLLTSEWFAREPEKREGGLKAVVRRWLVMTEKNRIMPHAGMDWKEYRGFEYMVQHMTDSICHIAMLLGYGWHIALGLGPGDAAHDFWFPFGSMSLRFALIAIGSGLARDLMARHVLSRASARYSPTCRYTRVNPGWLRNPRGLLRVAVAVMSSLWAVTVLTQLGHVFKQKGFVATTTEACGGVLSFENRTFIVP
jgi:hypothetical protein